MDAPRRRLIARVLALATASLAAACGDSAPEHAGPRPDVVVIVIDTLRPDHLPCYGHPRDSAPFLSALAAESTLFERAWSTSTWTAPATASLFTGLRPAQHGVTRGFFVHRSNRAARGEIASSRVRVTRLDAATPTLPEILARAGYETLGVSANVNVGGEIGFDRGFERFVRLRGEGERAEARAEDVVEALSAWEAELANERPDFVYLHFNDVHGPYERDHPSYRPQADERDDERAAYESEIRRVDEAIERAYRRFAWDRGTILVVVSDHGEEFGEHGGEGHGFSVYRELAQIALWVRCPELGVASQRIADNVAIADVLPTLVELLELPELAESDGSSLVPWLRAGDGLEARRAELRGRSLVVQRSDRARRRNSPLRAGEALGELRSVIEGDWQLIQKGEAFELYDLALDPRQERDLAAQRPEVVERLSAVLVHSGASARPAAEVELELDAAQLRELERLGYVGDE